MKIGIIQATSQAAKNQLLFDTVKKYAADDEVINFGCTENEPERFSYVEISVLAGMLLASGAVDFIVTGCSSGQGMMLACNSFPGVLCGYAPSPMDAWLFAQINNGNAVSLPLGEEYTWAGYENFENTVAKLFSEPFGQGYPKSEAARKAADTRMLKEILGRSQRSAAELLDSLDGSFVAHIMHKQDVSRYILRYENTGFAQWINDRLLSVRPDPRSGFGE